MYSSTSPTTDVDQLTQRYTGARAQDYDARREGTAKWEAEQAIVERLLRSLPSGCSLVDIPVGTGRFLPLYRQLGIHATGMDVSQDMLARAREKCEDATLGLSDIRRIDASDRQYDCALCVRFLNWVGGPALKAAVRELARVSRQHVILGVRCYAPVSGLGLRDRLRQQWARWQPRAEGRIIVHDQHVVQEAFREAGLRVRSADLVEASDGTEYRIYHLCRSL